MAVPHHLGLYGSGTYIWDDFQRRPWAVAAGASVYPFASQSWRINLHFVYVHESPTGSSFGFYTAGQTGPILSIGTDVLI